MFIHDKSGPNAEATTSTARSMPESPSHPHRQTAHGQRSPLSRCTDFAPPALALASVSAAHTQMRRSQPYPHGQLLLLSIYLNHCKLINVQCEDLYELISCLLPEVTASPAQHCTYLIFGKHLARRGFETLFLQFIFALSCYIYFCTFLKTSFYLCVAHLQQLCCIFAQCTEACRTY
jgi:hypothetical protein